MDDTQVFDVTSPGNILKLIRERGQRGITLRMLVAAVVEELGIGRSEARTLLRESLRELVRDGRVIEGRGQRFVVAGASELIPGVLRRQPAGFALVREADARAKPIRIDAHHLRGALDGDRVLVQLETARRRARAEGLREGVVVRVVERRLEEVVGRWVADRGRPCLKPIDRRLRFVLVPTGSRLAEEPRHGDYLVASVESLSARGQRARGSGHGLVHVHRLRVRHEHVGPAGRRVHLVHEGAARWLHQLAADEIQDLVHGPPVST